MGSLTADFSASEGFRLEAMFRAIKRWQGSISLPQVLAMIAIARHPGLSVNELAEELDQPQQTVSRHVAILLGRYQISEAEPISFIRQEISLTDPRSRALFLSEDGYAVLKALSADSPTTSKI